MTDNSNQSGIYIVVPGYNASPYLEDLAHSLSRQTYTGPKTVVFVNDGSSDDTLQVMESLEVDGFQKHVIAIEHAGVSATRNAGLSWVYNNANDGYVLFLDADDMLEDNAIQIIAEGMKLDDLDILAYSTHPFYENRDLERQFPTFKTYYRRSGSYPEILTGPDYLSAVLPNSDFRPSVCLQAFSVSFLKQSSLSFLPGIIHEDNLFSFEALLLANKVRYIDKELHIRRVRAGSIMTASAKAASLDGYFHCITEAINFMNRNHIGSASSKDCAAVIDMWQNAAIDHYNVLSKEQIEELKSSYETSEQVLFTTLIQQRAQEREDHRLEIERKSSEAQARAEIAVRSQFENSLSYRLGRAITAIPRKVFGR